MCAGAFANQPLCLAQSKTKKLSSSRQNFKTIHKALKNQLAPAGREVYDMQKYVWRSSSVWWCDPTPIIVSHTNTFADLSQALSASFLLYMFLNLTKEHCITQPMQVPFWYFCACTGLMCLARLNLCPLENCKQIISKQQLSKSFATSFEIYKVYKCL